MGIYNSLPLVARALSSQIGVTVTVGGTTAFATNGQDGPRINIPFYENAESIGDVLIGYSVHEAAHIRETNFKAYSQALESMKTQFIHSDGTVMKGRYDPNVVHHLVNLTEDLRIERKMIQRFPGTRDYLKELNLFLFNRESQPSDEPAAVFLNTMLLCGFKTFHGINIPTTQTRCDFDRLFGVKFYDEAISILSLAVNANCITECLAIALRLYDLAVDAFNSNEDDDKNQETSANSQSSESQDEKSPSDNTDGDPSTGTASDEDVPDSSQKTNEVSSDVHQTTDASPGCSDPFAGSDDDIFKNIIKGASEQINDALSSQLSPSELEPAKVPFNVAPGKSAKSSDIAFNRGIRSATGVRSAMQGFLQGFQHVRRTHRETGRKLDSRLLTSALTGNRKLFKHKSRAVDFNAAFTILLDSSASLRESIIDAEAAVISLLFALDGVKGVSTSAYHFPHFTGNSVGLLKSRDQNLRSAVNAHQFGIESNGNTPLTQSLWPAFCDLLSVKADRHILIVVTDGAPQDSRSAIKMIQDAKNDGITVIGIGFGSADESVMSDIFGNSGVAVGNVDSLRGHLLTLTRAALIH